MLDVLLHRLSYSMSPQRDLYRNIAQLADQRMLLSALDVGCGTGLGAVMLVRPMRRVIATDVDETVVEWVREMWGHLLAGAYCEPAQTTAIRCAASGSGFALVTCIEVIEHVEEPEELLAGLKACVGPGGLLVISTLNHFSQYRKNNAHVAPFNVATFRALLTATLGPNVTLTDFQLHDPLDDASGRTPMVALWEKPA